MTFKQILEAAKKNLATDIYISKEQAIFIRARGAVKAITKKDFTLSAEQIHQLITKIYKDESQRSTNDKENTTHYSLVNGANYKINICHKKLKPKIHLQMISKKIPDSEQLNIGFIDTYSTVQDGLVLLTGQHQSGLTHTLNSLLNASNIKNKKLIALISSQFPWQHRDLNSFIYKYNSEKSLSAAVNEALKDNCDQLFLDNLNLQDLENLMQTYSFDRPTFVTLNFASFTGGLKALKASSLYSIIKSQLQLMTHQRLIFSHKITRNIPVFEYATDSAKLFYLAENEAFIKSTNKLSELNQKDLDKSIITDELYLAQLVNQELLSSQQATQMSHRPNELMRAIASMDEQESTNIVENVSVNMPPPMRLNDQWTNIENIPIHDD